MSQKLIREDVFKRSIQTILNIIKNRKKELIISAIIK